MANFQVLLVSAGGPS